MISVITPSIRKEMLPIVEKCLTRQSFINYEWLVSSPENLGFGVFIKEPPKNKDDFYGLNKSLNAAFKKARGELFVIIMDGIWFPPDTLENLWYQYKINLKSVVSGIGHQYDRLENGKPEHIVWRDSRARTDQGSFYLVAPPEIEWSLVSFPRQAIYDVGGVPEDYDRGAALSEKITNLRFEKMGYALFLDQTLEYRAMKHERLGGKENWEKAYKITSEMYTKDVKEILKGSSRKLPYLPPPLLTV